MLRVTLTGMDTGGHTAYEQLLVERTGETITITLNNPAKRNALSRSMMAELTHALRAAGASDALAIVLAAQGPVFSAGHSFADMAGATEPTIRELFTQCTAMMDAIQEAPQPVVARVHALATAAGCQLVATCDLAVAADTAGFAIPGGKGGLFCTTPLVAISRNVGRKRALEMALSGDVISADQACDWGLINQCVPEADLDEAVAELVARVTRGSARSRTLGKRAFYQQVGLPQPQAYELAIGVMAEGAMLPDAQEGFAAFLEKRHPHFTSTP